MKKPIKININREPLNSDEIKKHQNFKNTWQKQYLKPKPFYKTPKFFGALLLILTTAVVLIIDSIENKNDDSSIPKMEIKPPFKNLDIPSDTFNIDAQKADTISYKSGTQIIIPADCFIDQEGRSITGKVAIQYREFNSTLELLLCGIPMAYDSAGKRTQLESAGMMEIKGFQNNKEVFIRNDKHLTINMPSSDDQAGVNLYKYEKNKNNWTYIGKDSVSNMIAEQSEKLIIKDNKIDSSNSETMAKALEYLNIKHDKKDIIKLKPLEPTAIKSHYESFMIDFNRDEFPELSQFENVKFQLLDSTININANDTATLWESVSLQQQYNRYRVIFFGQDRELSYQVLPAFEGKDLKKAQQQFEEKMKAYKKALNQKQKQESEARQQFLEAANIANERVIQTNKENALKIEELRKNNEANSQANTKKINEFFDLQKVNEAILQQNKQMSLIANVTRTFNIMGFGIYNCDRIFNMQQYTRHILDIDMPASVPLNDYTLYVVYKNKRSVINEYYHRDRKSQIAIGVLDPKNCKLFMVIDDKTIAVCDGPNIKKTIDGEFEKLPFELVTINDQNKDLASMISF